MLKQWFEVKVKYWKNSEEKEAENVSEVFLFDAVSWTDAEAKATEEAGKFAKSGFQIQNIKKKKIDEVFAYDSGEWYFNCAVDMIVYDEEKSKERKTRLNYLVNAEDLEEALFRMNESLQDSISDYVIHSLSVSPVLEVFTYLGTEEEFEKINKN